MDILLRFQEALKTPLGDLLIFLVITTLTLTFFYLYFWAKFRKKKDFLLKHFLEFKRTEKMVKEVTFIEIGKADFFGKSQIVSFSDGHFGRSLIFYPELSNEDTVHRFRDYQTTLKQADATYFPKGDFQVQNGLLVNIESQSLQRDGKSRINFAHYCLDSSLSISEKELFLMDLAHMLEALHLLKTEDGETLYHGFLLPQSFYLTLNMVKKITHTHLAFHGCAFAIGEELFHVWLDKILNSEISIDSRTKKELEKYLFILAPEQRDSTSKYSVAAHSDFYSFGALAAYLFTERAFEDVQEVSFEKIPNEWRGFIKSCLSLNPDDRPQNFIELKEYFTQPELGLSQELQDERDTLMQVQVEENLKSLKPFFDQIHQQKSESYFNEQWNEGYQAIHSSEWDKAFSVFQTMMKNDAHAFEAHLGLALTHYQKGEHDKAKSHYLQAKKIDGKKISCFHRLIAFDI